MRNVARIPVQQRDHLRACWLIDLAEQRRAAAGLGPLTPAARPWLPVSGRRKGSALLGGLVDLGLVIPEARCTPTLLHARLTSRGAGVAFELFASAPPDLTAGDVSEWWPSGGPQACERAWLTIHGWRRRGLGWVPSVRDAIVPALSTDDAVGCELDVQRLARLAPGGWQPVREVRARGFRLRCLTVGDPVTGREVALDSAVRLQGGRDGLASGEAAA